MRRKTGDRADQRTAWTKRVMNVKLSCKN